MVLCTWPLEVIIMDMLELIRSRRSVRRYADKPIPEEILRKIVEAGMYAPSAGNEQPWEFIMTTDKKVLAQIPALSPYAAMAKDAAAAILICGDVSKEKYKGFWVQDCAAATQNILLAAHSLGIGSVWTACYPMPDRVENLSKLFGLPKDVIPLALIPIGYPAEKPNQPARFDVKRVHKEKW
jgi:nitroreductase